MIKNRPFCILFPKVSVYRIDFDENECLYFMIKEEKVFDKYMEMWDKVNSELMCSKKYLTDKQHSTKKKAFYRKVIPVPVLLIDSIYREDEKKKKKKDFHSF